MSELNDLHLDCRQFRWDRPCLPHKQTGVTCPVCTQHDPISCRVLVVKLAATGDVLRTTALLPALHARHPGAHVTWLTAPAAVPLFARNPMVDAVWSSQAPETAARLAVQEFDVVYCPDADPAAAAFAAAARACERRGFTLEPGGGVHPLSPAAEHWFRMGVDDERKKANVRTYQALVCDALGLDPTQLGEPMLEPAPADQEAARAFCAAAAHRGKWIGLNTGAGARWPYKHWPREHQQRFVALATDAGHAVLLLGGPEEAARHAELLQAMRGRAVHDGGTRNSFHRFAALVEQCDVVVTGDTFALHVAVARRRPVVALFGPTSAAEIELHGRGERLIPPGFDCLACYLPRCDKQPYCQQGILPEAVLSAVTHWLR